MKLKSCIFWHLLFLDALVLHLRYGGMSVKDLLFHGVCLGLATALLATHKRTYPVPRSLLFLFAGVLALILFQLIPLPQGLFPVLAPIKHRLVTVISSLYPDIDYGSQIAIVPEVTLMKLITLVLDMYLIILAIMAPKPNARLFRFWLVSLSLVMGSLAIITSWESPHAYGLTLIYKGSFGALVNPNNFAALGNILMVLLFSQFLISARSLYHLTQDKNTDSRKQLEKGLFCLFYCFCYLHMFFGFQKVSSRSGVLGFVLVHLLFVAFFLFEMSRSGKKIFTGKRIMVAVGLVAILIGSVSVLPTSKSIMELQNQGLSSKSRVGFLKIGVDYLAEYPIMGAGLGAAECILEVVQPKTYEKGNARHFHNEYLQVAVELGIIGVIALAFFLWFVAGKLMPGLTSSSFEKRSFFYALVSILIFLALLCNISFPLRITSIRVLVILLVFIGIRMASDEKRQSRSWPVLAGMAGVLACTMLWLVPTAFYQPGEGADLKTVQRAVRYGNLQKEPFFTANAKLSKLLRSQSFGEKERAVLDEIEKGMYLSLNRNPINFKAVNVLFVIEAIEDKLDHPTYDEQRFARLRQKAQVINDLGKGANINAQSAFLFLFGMYQNELNEEDQAFYTQLKETYRLNLRLVEKALTRERREAAQSK